MSENWCRTCDSEIINIGCLAILKAIACVLIFIFVALMFMMPWLPL